MALTTGKLIAFAATTDYEKARAFFEGVLGLPLVTDQRPFALVFDSNGTMLRVTKVPQHAPAPYTVLGWDVADIESAVSQLTTAGVAFLRFPGLNDSDPLGIWNAPGGIKVAWFHDPDNNVLSLSQIPQTAE